jgi:hypothetical protein
MRKLEKIMIHDHNAEILSDNEMKMVVGGTGVTGTTGVDGGAGGSSYCPEGEQLYNCTYSLYGGSVTGAGLACGVVPVDAEQRIRETLARQLDPGPGTGTLEDSIDRTGDIIASGVWGNDSVRCS